MDDNFQILNLTENPFPQNPIIIIDNNDKRINGLIAILHSVRQSVRARMNDPDNVCFHMNNSMNNKRAGNMCFWLCFGLLYCTGTVLYRTVLCYAMLYYTGSYSILYYTTPQHSIPYNSIPYHSRALRSGIRANSGYMKTSDS